MVDQKESFKNGSKQSERNILDKILAEKLDEAETLGEFLKGIRGLERLSLVKMGIKIAELEKRDTAYNDKSIFRWENDQFIPLDNILEVYKSILQEKINEGIVSQDKEGKFQELIDKTPERKSVGRPYKIKAEDIQRKNNNQWTDQIGKENRETIR